MDSSSTITQVFFFTLDYICGFAISLKKIKRKITIIASQPIQQGVREKQN